MVASCAILGKDFCAVSGVSFCRGKSSRAGTNDRIQPRILLREVLDECRDLSALLRQHYVEIGLRERSPALRGGSLAFRH